MVKVHKLICIDYDVAQQLKLQGVNVSGTCNEFLKAYARKQGTGETQDLEKAKEELIKLEGEIASKRNNLIALEANAKAEAEEESKWIDPRQL